MIAVVSSTIAPSAQPGRDGARTTFTREERLEHTRGTIASLQAAGLRDILVVDNSPGDWVREHAASLAPARVLHCGHPAYSNKGIGEMWLLLAALEQLPAGVPILKISGRYRLGPQSPLFQPSTADVTARVYAAQGRPEISTRGYVLRDRAVAARYWPRVLDEMYAQSSRVVGPRSLWRILRNSWRPAHDAYNYSDPPAAVEHAAYDAIRHLGLSLRAVDHLALEGVIGSGQNPPMKE